MRFGGFIVERGTRYGLNGSMAYEQVARFFGFASLDLSGVARTACIFPWIDYIWSMEFSTIWPIVVLLLTYLACRDPYR